MTAFIAADFMYCSVNDIYDKLHIFEVWVEKLFETKTARFSFQSGFHPQTRGLGVKNCVP